ncbi:TetR/AcrR family transcriptional regulator [Actinospica durhamensis]|uniref:TetR/AcrR family transcriptional regulator n=1 Tax=Actinospica durhamensis TaxID=1508375 RepID=A0A941ERD7_9ACTN|nr:TetR/AcrR family transcriptional regulator [Actinospica durhamensis]MBR7836597.1 TetR/AcrR family transcriptional regulator [Actinospica durhamensis]
MPKLWNETIAGHRETVRETIMDTAWRLVGERGLSAVTMSQIAEQAGIGRATLYKYFPDVEAIVIAWHERQIGAHLARLAAIRDEHTDPGAALRAVLTGYAHLSRHRGAHPGDLTSFLHRGAHTDTAQQHLRALVTHLVADAAAAGAIRTDTAPDELATYALHALAAAADLPDDAAVNRLVGLVTAGLLPDPGA